MISKIIYLYYSVNKFKFLQGYNHKSLRQPILDRIIDMCQEYSNYVELCRRDYLSENPQDVGRDDYSFPIDHYRIEEHYPEGQLWHGGTDYNQELDRLEHFLFLDMNLRTHEDLYITVHESEEGEYTITSIEDDDSRWQ